MKTALKMHLRKIIDKFSRIRQYFLRGHGQWFALFFNVINFTVITFYLLIQNLTIFPKIRFYMYFILFILTYFPIATFIGYLDYKKGTFAEEQRLVQQASPIWRELFFKLDRIEKNLEELKNELEQQKKS